MWGLASPLQIIIIIIIIISITKMALHLLVKYKIFSIYTAKPQKLKNRNTNKAKMSNKQTIKTRIQYLQRSLNMAKATSIAARPVFHYFSGLSGWFAKSSLQIICLNNKIHFFFAGAIKSPCYQGKLYEIKAFTHSQQQTYLWISSVGMGGCDGWVHTSPQVPEAHFFVDQRFKTKWTSDTVPTM